MSSFYCCTTSLYVPGICVCTQPLLLYALQYCTSAVRQRMPDGKHCSWGSLNLILVFSLSSFKDDLYFLCLLAALPVAFTSTARVGMHGNKAGVRSPRTAAAKTAAAKPPLYIYEYVSNLIPGIS